MRFSVLLWWCLDCSLVRSHWEVKANSMLQNSKNWNSNRNEAHDQTYNLMKVSYNNFSTNPFKRTFKLQLGKAMVFLPCFLRNEPRHIHWKNAVNFSTWLFFFLLFFSFFFLARRFVPCWTLTKSGHLHTAVHRSQHQHKRFSCSQSQLPKKSRKENQEGLFYLL